MKINKAIILVDRHIAKYYKKPTIYYGMDRIKFRKQSYAHSFATELRNYLNEHRDCEPIGLVEEFRYAMNDFACAAKTPKQNFMFSVAYDVATDILDMLIIEV